MYAVKYDKWIQEYKWISGETLGGLSAPEVLPEGFNSSTILINT